MADYVLLLDQTAPYLNAQFCEIPQGVQERISQAGMDEKTETHDDGVEEYEWTYIEAEDKYLSDAEAQEVEEGEGIRKGKGIRNKIKTEHYYIWDKLSRLEREYKVAKYDFENCPGFREKAASSKLTESITPYLETDFSDLPQEIKMKIAFVDHFQHWDEKNINRYGIASFFDGCILHDNNPEFLIGLYSIKEEWDKYAKKKVLLANEAIPLMNGVDPESWKECKNNQKGLHIDMIRSIDRCLKIAEAEEKQIATPSEWLAWGRIHDLNKPTIKSDRHPKEPDVCMWEYFESAVNRYVEETNKYRNSHNKPESDEANRGIGKQEVMAAFQDIKWNYYHWGKNLASPPKWLEKCRVMKGSKKESALWNPVYIGIELLDKGESIKKLDRVFAKLQNWNNEWKDKTELEERN